ncbi:hypothetical protein SKAU_G00096400 [Synaphobranchus kaupii]|uniref:Peptidase A2 domain-containing protein n=1 Tax=Synaphobranchus kaupii TaxID=118154 RepID=A0A9Q1FXX7_SYNKA|nr:hypothetical protein SKAU_G00096400 [Synaphobranchus kaupii]
MGETWSRSQRGAVCADLRRQERRAYWSLASRRCCPETVAHAREVISADAPLTSSDTERLRAVGCWVEEQDNYKTLRCDGLTPAAPKFDGVIPHSEEKPRNNAKVQNPDPIRKRLQNIANDTPPCGTETGTVVLKTQFVREWLSDDRGASVPGSQHALLTMQSQPTGGFPGPPDVIREGDCGTEPERRDRALQDRGKMAAQMRGIGPQREPSDPLMGSNRVTEKAAKALKESAFGDCLTVEVKIAGVKTNCLLDTGSKVTTITESHFKQHFGEKELTLELTHNWVKLTAANGLDIPVLGCLEADIECMGETLSRKCVFVLTDDKPVMEEMKGLPGILGMNVISELQTLFTTGEGVKRVDRDHPRAGEAGVRK